MNDDVTEVDGIVVVGQRRYEMNPFPSLPIMPDPIPPGMADELPGEAPDEIPFNPCANPETRKEWNTDAAAAEALRRMIDAALNQNGEPDFVNREYGAVLCEAQNGDISVGPIVWGDPILDEDGNMISGNQPSVPIDYTVCGSAGTPIGMIHSHPGVGAGTLTPSVDDIANLDYINTLRGDQKGRIYISGRLSSSDRYRIYIYNEQNKNSGQRGPEVNPDGEPCPN